MSIVENANASGNDVGHLRHLHLTFYSDEITTAPCKFGECDWEQFAARLSRHDIRQNKSGPAFSPVKLKVSGNRCNADVEAITSGVADSDKGALFDEVVGRFIGLAAVIYTTHSNTAAIAKCRAVVPFSAPVDVADWPACRAGLVERFGADIFDPATKDASRIYYLPSCPAETANLLRAVVLEGEFLDPASLIVRGRKLLADGGNSPAPKLVGQESANFAGLRVYAIPSTVAEGQRNSELLRYCAHLRGRGVSEDLIQEAARDFNRARCTPPLNNNEVDKVCQQFAKPAADDPNGWPDPQSIDAPLPEVVPFDLGLLPDSFRPFVEDHADLMQIAPDFIAAPMMVAAAADIGNTIAIAPKEHDTSWLVSPVLWGGVVGRPGVLKSPAIDRATRSLHIIEQEMQKAFDQRKAQYTVDKMLYEAGMKKAKAAAANGQASTPMAEPVEPQPEYIVVNDSTAQNLGEILRHSPRGVLVLRDELVSLLESLAAEGQEGSRGFYLEGWNGLNPHRVGRIGRGNFIIPRHALWVFGGIQPGRLQAYIGQAVTGGNGDDGLLQRFQLLVWPDSQKDWCNIDRTPNFAAIKAVEDTFLNLRHLDPVAIGACVDPFGNRPAYLQFTTEAQEDFNSYRTRLERLLGTGDRHPALESHLAKYRSLVPALALVIHLADRGTGPVTRTALRKAIRWTTYLWSHAQRVYASVTNLSAFGAKTLSVQIANGRLANGFTAREVQRHGWEHLDAKDKVRTALDWLVDAGWLRETRTAPDGGGRPTDVFVINPKVQRK